MLARLNHRMDFLILLPNGIRVIVEVDGPQHYSGTKAVDGTVRGDRELKLRGYDVWRVTTSELRRQSIPAFVERFFTNIFKHHGVEAPLAVTD
ncbi:DUF559 domain-containing protein [Kitasatospora sp. NPDC056651]|uniref:DUF559 domain-containing protein n=1 Tax=Kitasatospora sp. NPDC056651 TaxID=3345892 RepID=UPI0036B3E8F6